MTEVAINPTQIAYIATAHDKTIKAVSCISISHLAISLHGVKLLLKAWTAKQTLVSQYYLVWYNSEVNESTTSVDCSF